MGQMAAAEAGQWPTAGAGPGPVEVRAGDDREKDRQTGKTEKDGDTRETEKRKRDRRETDRERDERETEGQRDTVEGTHSRAWPGQVAPRAPEP